MAREFAARWDVPRHTTDLAAAIEDPSTDTVVIGLPNAQHEEVVALAARGAVTLHTAKYALDDFQSALTDLDAGNVRGRAILIP